MRSVWLLLFLSILAVANERVTLIATCLDSNSSGVKASDNVSVFYDDYHLSAKRAHYSRDSSVLELFGSVVAMKGDEYLSLGEYAKFDINKKERLIRPFFLLDRNQSIWMSSHSASADNDLFEVDSGVVSSCDVTNPLWQIHFGGAEYNSQTRWINLYNAWLNIYGVPLFYLPYFGYSLDDRRRSGLLMPYFGLSSSEGFFYEQPLYIAPHKSFDIELRPQIRTTRGVGLYSKLRFVDSNVSSGSLRVGYFKEDQKFADKFDLANSEHYGLDFKYANSEVLDRWLDLKLDGESGLYADISLMSDIAYINLSSNDETKNATSNQILSRVNLFYNTQESYYGANFRYYLDLKKQSNDDTLQSLPSLRYHRYLKSFLDEHMYYTFNIKTTNLYRPRGVNAIDTDLYLPLTLQASFWDEWISLSYSAQMSGKYITFSGRALESNVLSKSEYNSGIFARFYHNINLNTQSFKRYSEYTHTVVADASYRKAGVEHRSGYYEDKQRVCNRYNASDNFECDFYSIANIEEVVDVKLTQFVNAKDGSQLLYHRLSQRLSLDPLKERLSELENEIDWKITPSISIYSDLFFNYQRSLLSKMISSVRYNDKTFSAKASFMYEDRESDIDLRYTNYLVFDLLYRHSEHYDYFAKVAYDVEYSRKKYAEIGFLYSKRCWEFGLRYVENNRPILAQNRASSVYDRYIYLTLQLSPIGGAQMNYKLSRTQE